MTLDRDYIDSQQSTSRRRPSNIKSGVASGAEKLGNGLFDAVSGVFLKPIEGAQQGGLEGFAKGMGQGLLGLAAKPAVGVLSFATDSADGMKHTITQKAKIGRQLCRYPDLDRWDDQAPLSESDFVSDLTFT